MKRLIAALGLAAVAVSASAVEYGAPFEQLNIERALPQIGFAAVNAYVADARAPYEQLAIDRALPNLPAEAVHYASASGSTRTDASGAAEASTVSPWANDHNFIAPAQ